MRLSHLLSMSLLVWAQADFALSQTPQTETIPGTDSVGFDAHYLVIEADQYGGLNVVHHQMVTLESPLQSLSNKALAELSTKKSGRLEQTSTVRVLDRNGRTSFQTVVEIPRWVRGEFLIDPNDPSVQLDGSNINGHLIEREVTSFVVRVPALGEGLELHVQPSFSSVQTQPIELDFVSATLVAPISAAVAGVPEFISGWNNGPNTNRLDLLILGDGYTSTQESSFNADAASTANGFTAITPYQEYGNYLNIRRIFTASQQSGADRPTCSDPGDMGLDNNTFVNTAFDATFCSYGTWRLLTVNPSKVLAAAAAAPEWDEILVIVNSSIYGGAGGFPSTASMNASSVDIMRHEFGHAFTKLADEYVSAGTAGTPACSDTDTSQTNNCEANVTDQTSRANVKWKRWISASTPVPTFDPLANTLAAGLWEGARYLPTGMYRQGYNCLMRNLGTPFCNVDREAYVSRLYDGEWGVPSNGVNNFDSTSPATADVTIVSGTAKTFGAKALGPRSGTSLAVTWYKNGAVVQQQTVVNGANLSYTYTPNVVGAKDTVMLRVVDQSPLLHSTIRESKASERVWNVTVSGPIGC